MLRFSGPSLKVKFEPTLGLGPSSDVRLRAFQKKGPRAGVGIGLDPSLYESMIQRGKQVTGMVPPSAFQSSCGLQKHTVVCAFCFFLLSSHEGCVYQYMDKVGYLEIIYEKKMSHLIILKNSVLKYVPIMVIALLFENSWSFPVGRDNPSPQKRSCSNSLLR